MISKRVAFRMVNYKTKMTQPRRAYSTTEYAKLANFCNYSKSYVYTKDYYTQDVQSLYPAFASASRILLLHVLGRYSSPW